MRKIVTLRLWIDDDELPEKEQGGADMEDSELLNDLQSKISFCWHNFEIIKFESMVIANEKCSTNNASYSVCDGKQ